MKVLVIAAIALILAGCGSKKNDGESDRLDLSTSALTSEETLQILALDGKGPLEVAKVVGAMSFEFKDPEGFFALLDKNLEIECRNTCLIKRK